MFGVENDPTHWTRTEKWVLGALVAGLLATLAFSVHPWFEDVNDASIYILTARSIVAGEGYSYQGVPFIIRPPGFALLIAPILQLRGTDFFALNLLVSSFGAATVALVFAFYRKRLGTWPCLAVCLAIVFSGGWQRLCNQVLSDVPATTVMFAALLLDRRVARTRSLGGHAALGLLIGAGMYLRTINVLLLPAIVCARLAARFFGRTDDERRVAWGALALTVLVPMLMQVPWNVRNSDIEVPIPPEHVFLHSYEAAMWHTNPEDPGSPRVSLTDVLGRMPMQLEQLLPSIGSRLQSSQPEPWNVALGVLALALWLVALIRRRGTADFLAGGIVVSLAIYFAFKTRLALPAFLLLFPTFVDTSMWLLGKARLARPAPWIAVALVAVIGALDFHPFGHWPTLEKAHRNQRRVAKYCRETFPDGAPLAAPIGWHYGVHMPERRVYSMRIITTRKSFDDAMARMRERDVAGILCSTSPGEGLYLRAYSKLFEQGQRIGDHVVFDTPP
jgi:4-amino-4-deoxy-L-arabinose transferase-like glycosyltransferase